MGDDFKALFKILKINTAALFSYDSYSDSMDSDEFYDLFDGVKFESTDQFISTIKWFNNQVNTTNIILKKVLKNIMKNKTVSDDMKLWYRLDGVNGINSKT